MSRRSESEKQIETRKCMVVKRTRKAHHEIIVKPSQYIRTTLTGKESIPPIANMDSPPEIQGYKKCAHLKFSRLGQLSLLREIPTPRKKYLGVMMKNCEVWRRALLPKKTILRYSL
jgi:hypothetical protein